MKFKFSELERFTTALRRLNELKLEGLSLPDRFGLYDKETCVAIVKYDPEIRKYEIEILDSDLLEAQTEEESDKEEDLDING